MTHQVEKTCELKRSSFGAYRQKQRVIPNKGFEKAYLGVNSRGPTIYGSPEQAKLKEKLSVTRNSNKHSVPRTTRFGPLTKNDKPAPTSYLNTNEVAVKSTLKTI